MTSQRATAWSVTINNPTKADEENISSARQNGWKVHGQLEAGKEGTPHYQLAVFTPQVRFAALKKAFPRSHIEVCRDKHALMKYVSKEETRVEALRDDDKYPSLQKLWDMFSEYVVDQKGRHLTWGQDQWLTHFDKFIRLSIDQGYVVETMAVNPQIRACVKHYAENIINRSLRRQTDRQTAEKDVEVNSINPEDEEGSETETKQESTVQSESDEEVCVE